MSNSVYDDEKEKLGNQVDAGDTETNSEHLEAGAKNQEGLNSAESSPKDSGSTNAGDKEKEKLDDQVGRGYSGSEKDTTVRDGSKRKKGILAGVLVTGAVGAGSLGFLAFPGFLVNHLREVLLGNVSSLQTHQSIRYRRAKLAKVSDMFSRDGRRGGKIIAEMQSKGYTFDFDPTDRNKVIGLRPPGDSWGIANIEDGLMAEEFADFIDKRHPLRSAKWKTKRMEALYTRFKVSRKAVVTPSPDDLDDPKKAVNQRLAQEIIDDPNIDERLNVGDAPEDMSEEDIARRNSELEGVAKSDGSLDSTIDQLRNEGKSFDELTPEEKSLLTVGTGFDEGVADIAERAARGSIGSMAWRAAKGFFSSTDVFDKVCIVKKRLDGVVLAARTYRAVRLLKYTSEFVKASDATRTGQVDPKLMRELMGRVTSADINGNSFGSSPGFIYAMKGKFSKSQNDAFKASYGVDGQLAGVFKAVQDSTENIPGTSPGQCRIIQNPVAQIGAGILEIGAAILSGGGSAAGTTAAKTTIKQAVSSAIKSVTKKQLAKSLAKTAAIELSFEGIMALTQIYAEKSLAIDFTGQENGGSLSGILVGGSGVLNKQRSFEAGMVPATTQQYASAQTRYLAEKKLEQEEQGLYTRYLDYSNSDSLAFKSATLLISAPLAPDTLAPALARTATSILSNPMQLISSIFTGQVLAQADADPDLVDFESYTTGAGDVLATDPAGNLLPVMRDDIEAIDPEINIQELTASGDINSSTLEPESDEFKKHVEHCVHSVDTISQLEDGDPHDCIAKKSITVKYKAHLAYIDMLDGIDAALFPEEISSEQGSGGTGSSPSGTNTSGSIVGDPYSDTTSVPCAEGTTDIGLQDAYVSGRMFKSRMCSVSNLPSHGQADNPGGTFSTPGANGHAIVNSRVSGAWYKLVEDASAAGISLSVTSSFRSMPHQQSLWNRNPNSSLVARPGFSSHQAGVAIDFSNMSGKRVGATCETRATNSGPAYQWLRANAAQYGFKQYAVEAWHWDALSASSRCS